MDTEIGTDLLVSLIDQKIK